MPRGGQPGTPALVHRTFKTKPLQIKPLRIKRSPVHHHEPGVLPQLHRSPALAMREGGIGTQPRHKAPMTGLERAFFIRQHREQQSAMTRRAVAGAHPGALAQLIGGLPRAVYNNPVVGHKGAIGGIEDLAQTFNPVALERTLVKTAEHPLASRSSTQLNAGVVVPGFGRFGGVKSITLPEEVAGKLPPAKTPEEVVARSLGTARKLRGKQKKLYHEELTARVGRAQAASEAAGGGAAGHAAAMKELKGELPKTTFENLMNGKITQDDLHHLAVQADMHPDLSFFDKVTVNEALRKAVNEGRTPTPSEIKLLQKVYGQEVVKAVGQRFGLGSAIVDALNVPRSLMASFDVSAPFRQGLVAGARHPVLFAKNFPGMFKAFGSESRFQAQETAIHERPNAPLYEVAGLKLPKLEGMTSKNREEQFSSQLAERVPGIGHVVRASGRAYESFLNGMRADMFDHQLVLAKKAGVNTEDIQQLRGIASVVNTATGRGGLGPVESWAPALNAVFFSPRLIASRVNLLNPIWYARLPPFARRQAIRSMVQLGAAAGGVLTAGTVLGGKVVTDPRSADFAKLRIGNTRVDVLGGLQQYVRLASQVATGQVISSTTGETMTLGPGFGKMNREDIIKRFALGKASPPVTFLDDMVKGTTFAGQPFNLRNEVLARTVPLVAQDAYDLYKSKKSIQLAMLGYAISMFGIGMQTYGPKPVKAKRFGGGSGAQPKNPYLGGGGGSGNPYLPSGGGSSNPYLP